MVLAGSTLRSTIETVTGYLSEDDAKAKKETDLLACISAGSCEDLSELYDRYAKPIYFLFLRATRDPGLSEDLLQEFFIKVWNRSASFDEAKAAPRAWLFAIARHLVIDHHRCALLHSSRSGNTEKVEEGGDHHSAPNLQRTQWMRALLDRLPVWEKQVLELAYFSGYSQTEIATRLDRPLGTVKSWTRSGLIRLRACLTPSQA